MLRRFLRGGLLAALLLLLGTQALAAPESPLASMQAEPTPGFVTRITDTTGAVYEKSGVLDPEGSEIAMYSAAISSYELYYDGRLLMTVVPSGFSVQDRPAVTGADSGASLGSTGFYKTTFSIDDTREIFLTGLTESTLQQVQTELTASALQDRYFNLTNVDFIDAEKEYTDVAEGEIASDANLCWAAATSNMLRFSGWGSAAGFKTEDALFESFISAFTDAGGSYTYALDWFFNGNYRPQDWDNWSHLRAPGKSGAYLPDYAADSLYQTYEISAHIDNLRLVFDALERDCAVGISIGNYISWLRSGGHAITLWGYMRDTSASPYSKKAYPAIFISDSDSDKYDGNLRREAPNRLRVMMMDGMFDGFGDDSWELDYPSTFPWRIDSFTVLEPYSEEIEKDTSGTHDKYAFLDFSVQDLCVRSSIFDEMDLSIYTIPTGQSIRINGSVVNNSPYVFSGDLTVKTEASITRVRDGVRVWKDSSTTNYLDQCSAYSHTDFSFSSSSLPEGGYELTVCVSADGLEEAYTVNNTRSIAFTVTAAAPDTSGASVSIDIPEFDGDEGGVGTLTFTGVDSLYPAGTKLTWSVYEKYTSVLAKNWVLAYQGYDMPDSVRYVDSGKTVQTRVVLRPVDPALACVTLNAGSQTLLYYDLFALEADDNTDKCSSIPYGQKSLAAGEQFSFYISNYTTCVPSIKATPAVYAIRESDHARIDLWRGDPVSMAYGKSTKKTPHRVTSWDAELLPGQYTIYGEATYEYGSKTVLLSSLQVNADKPFVSIGRTFRGSKCCAVVLDCQAPAGDVVLGIEYREEGQEEVQFVSDSLSFASYSVSETRCLSFDTDLTTNYSFRTVCKQNGETFYGEWMECPEPSARQALTQTPQSGSAGDTVWEYTAEEDGVYVLTVNANADVVRYDNSQKKADEFNGPNTGRADFFLKKGETVLFLIQTQDAYTAAVLPPDAIELCKTAFFTTGYVGSKYLLQFTAPAAGTYTLHTEGPWGWIYQLCEDGTWLLSWHFSSDRPGNFSFTLKKGQTACFRFTNMKAGDFAITVSRPDPEVSVSDDGVHVSYDPECTGLHMIALYDTDGQLIDIRSVSVRSLEEHISAVLQGTRTGYVRVFQLDAEKHTPRTAAKQAELA